MEGKYAIPENVELGGDRINISELERMASESKNASEIQESASDRKIDPADRIYNARYGTTDLAGALANMMARKKDPSKNIPGGLSDNNPMLSKKMAMAESAHNVQAKGQRKIKVSDRIFALEDGISQISRKISELSSAPKNGIQSPAAIEGSESVTFELNGLKLNVQAVKVIHEKYCVVIVFRSDGSMNFVPDVKTVLKLSGPSFKDGGADVFYPGINFSLPELNLTFLGFIRGDIGEESGNER